MSAADHVNPNQLQMLMPAGQIINEYEPEYSWDKKLAEAKEPLAIKDSIHRSAGVYDDIKANGIQNPVTLYEGRMGKNEGKAMGNGTHRVASARDLDPTTEVLVHQSLPLSELRAAKKKR